jgi:hypothetical protein
MKYISQKDLFFNESTYWIKSRNLTRRSGKTKICIFSSTFGELCRIDFTKPLQKLPDEEIQLNSSQPGV